MRLARFGAALGALAALCSAPARADVITDCDEGVVAVVAPGTPSARVCRADAASKSGGLLRGERTAAHGLPWRWVGTPAVVR